MSYDISCYTLAGKFLSDFEILAGTQPNAADTLAQAIQDAVESELEDMVDSGRIRALC